MCLFPLVRTHYFRVARNLSVEAEVIFFHRCAAVAAGYVSVHITREGLRWYKAYASVVTPLPRIVVRVTSFEVGRANTLGKVFERDTLTFTLIR